MKLITVHKQEEGQRLVKLLGAYLKEAPTSFFYKMLRKKNITLNGKKADGTEKLKSGDEIRLFLSDETYEKFAGKARPKEKFPTAKLNIVYEDSNVIFINKPAGMLSQKSVPSDVSLNEYLLGYLEKSGQWKQEESKAFRPSVCNRLDRNTSGMVICGKSMAGLQQMSALLKDRSLHKYYLCLVKGIMTESQHLEGYLLKNESTNQVQIFKEEAEGASCSGGAGSSGAEGVEGSEAGGVGVKAGGLGEVRRSARSLALNEPSRRACFSSSVISRTMISGWALTASLIFWSFCWSCSSSSSWE